MAEALGIASGVAGIVSLGITICSGLDTFFSAIKDRDDDVKRACELLSLFRTYIDLIESKASILSSRHAQATDLVVLALKFCESELRTLKKLVDSLKVDDSSDVARKWDKSKSVIKYPFQQKKLTQVQDQLLKATGTLGTIVQPLILNVGVGVAEDLEAFKSAVQGDHLVTTAFLTRLESKVEMIGSSADHTESTLAAILTGVEEQKTVASSSQELIKDTSLMVSGKLDALAQSSCLGPQSQAVGTAQRRDTPRHLRNAMIESKCVQESTTAICPCQIQGRATGRQPSATYRLWGGLSISHRAMSKASHQPGCCFYKRSTKTTITYNGLRFLLSKVLCLSLERDYQPGGCSTTLSLRTYNIREWSPGFELFSMSNIENEFFVEEHMKKLQVIYSSGKASPFDVDNKGYNAAHMCIEYYGGGFGFPQGLEWEYDIRNMKMMLQFLQRIGVNIHAGTNRDSSMLEFVIREYRYRALGPVYDVLASCEPQFDAELDCKPGRYQIPVFLKGTFLNVLHGRSDVMEGLGYRNLFLAVSKRDEAMLKELIKTASFSEYVSELDYFGQNILHFCLNWETGLRLLLEQEATHHLVSQRDATGMTPLEDALDFSQNFCSAPCGAELGCSAIVELLLETDCPVGLGLFNSPYADGTTQVTIVLLEHLAQRRKRLQMLALQHLPETELRHLGVSRTQLPDTNAPAIWEKLQPLHQSGVVGVLHNGLDPSSGSSLIDQSRRGIFHLLRHPLYAEVAFNLGFKGIDTPDRDGATPIMYSGSDPFTPTEVQLLCADWLIKKGARLDDCTNSWGISAAHNLAFSFGGWVRHEFFQTSEHVQPSKKIVPLLSALVYSTSRSRLPCPCATEELSQPLHYFVVSALSNTSKFGVFLQPMKPRFAARRTAILAMCLGSILSNIASNVDVTYLSKSIIHVLTMEALGVRHLPYCHESVIYSEEKAQKVKEEEEWDEILDEDRALIEKLDELTGEFEQEFFNQNLPIGEFLRLHWHPRIRQVQRELRSLVESQRQQLRQLGVVLDDKCEQFPDYDLDDNYALDYDQDWDPDAWQDVNHCGDAYFDEDYGDEDSEDEYYEDEYSEPEDSEHKDSEDEDSANEGTEIERE